ncbi:RICIN domain-containing protein [Micromonospora sp. NPDC049799]|uniref:RICIN domain-containing protein n=1 Tax=unclassified Micromonospora TaxID=2617518 RepID=UPI0033FA0E45
MSAPAHRPDESGTVYGGGRAARPGLPGDPLLRTALIVGVVGVLLGVFFATGVLGGGGDEPVVPAAAGAPTAEAEPTPTPVEPEPTTPAAPSDTPSAPPTTAPAPVSGPKVFRAVASGLCFGVDGSGEKATAQLAACTGGPEQQWVANPVAPDVVTLTNAAYGLCLDVEGASGDDGTKLQQFPCHGQANQQWRMAATGTGPVLLVALHSGKCAQVDDGGTEAGDDVEQAPCGGGVEQQWLVG